ncbi:hypothetical protein [Streptomyces sp. NPDC006335]|uniref:hypothetical protein n=1 Tax=Streptomyces sp. NPDC006335 TaxID=3156895 RepID=UPI0033B28D8E
MGHSLGADHAMDHAETLPKGPRALILTDGAVPTHRPLHTEGELTAMRESLRA